MLGTRARIAVMAVLGLLVVSPSPATADQVILDDVIVDGSVCAGGADCKNEEDFQFDTVRLKSLSPRLTFRDTSNSASFPTNDWELRANDLDGSGSANYFAFADLETGATPLRILAGAPSDTLRLDPDGNLVTTQGALAHSTVAIENAEAVDGDAILAALTGLPISRYEFVADPDDRKHIGPLAADFNTTFGVGSGTELLAPADVAGVALAAAKRIAARVVDLAGPRGETGPQGPVGPAGATGPRGKDAEPSEGLKASLKRLAKIQRSHKRLRKRNAKLARQVTALKRKLAKAG